LPFGANAQLVLINSGLPLSVADTIPLKNLQMLGWNRSLGADLQDMHPGHSPKELYVSHSASLRMLSDIQVGNGAVWAANVSFSIFLPVRLLKIEMFA
jgi:hypothetical protein